MCFNNLFLRFFKTKNIMSFDKIFKLSNYDAVCLDFDNTLVQYNLSSLFQLHYKHLSRYLIQKKGYKNLPDVMNKDDIDFIRKGLFLDFDRGNILNLSAKGTIISASHGTKKLDKNAIIDSYGPEMRWTTADFVIKDKLEINRHIPTAETYSFLDFTDITAVVVYAKIVDLIEEEENTAKNYRPAWDHVIDSVIDMYRLDSEFSKTFDANVAKYVYQCKTEIIDWLCTLKENHKLILITSANPSTFKNVAKHCLGASWQYLFHTIIDLAGKPNFFIGKTPFKNRANEEITMETINGHYRNGNWQTLYNVLSKEIGRPARCVYVGDHIVHDVYAPSLVQSLDSVFILEEIQAEGVFFNGEHPHSEYIRSKFWGSCLRQDGMTTLLGDIVMKHSKLCVPSLMHLASKPADFCHKPFWVFQLSNNTDKNNYHSNNYINKK